MALDPVKLDDLTWDEMITASRRRIPAASVGEWTLHAPVDPGITLLELFAYLLEQRVYWMDHVSDSVVHGALSLLGERPKPTQVAATVMHFPEIDQLLVVPAESQFTLSRTAPPLIFSADDAVALLPFEKSDGKHERVGLDIENSERTADLEHGKVMRLFPANGGSGEVRIALFLREPLPPNIEGKRFSLLFKLFESNNVIPQWAPNAVDAPPPATISWFYGPKDKRVPFSPNEVNDGTGGLRRSGVVTLPLKQDWEHDEVDPSKPGLSYSLWMVVEKATFSAPPRLERLVPNVVIARHQRKTAEHTLKREWLPLPGNELGLADLPENELMKDHPAIENTIALQIRERDDQWHEWKQTEDLAFHGPADRVFVADRTLATISFGDGLTGRLPVLMNDEGGQFKLHYSVGGGIGGKLGANLKWIVKALSKFDGEPTDSAGFFEVENVVQTTGGEDPETIFAFRERAAASLQERTRAVIREDFEEIARTVAGVQISRAHAAVGFHPSYPCTPIPGAVTVFLLPDVSRPDILNDEFDEIAVESAFVAAPVPDAGALATVRNALDLARLAGTEVFVMPPFYRKVKLTLVIESNAADRADLGRRVKQQLCRFFDPLIGGDEGTGWPFGEPVRPSAILREAQRELGDDGTLLNVFIDLPQSVQANYQLDTLSGGVTPDCSMVQQLSPEQPPCSSTALGSREAKEFRRDHSGAIREGVLVSEPTCDDVEIGPHHLVELLPIEVRFQRALEIQGGLR